MISIEAPSCTITVYIKTLLFDPSSNAGEHAINQLHVMVDHELKKLPFTASFREFGHYDQMYFSVETDIDKIDETLNTMDHAVTLWIDQHNIIRSK